LQRYPPHRSQKQTRKKRRREKIEDGGKTETASKDYFGHKGVNPEVICEKGTSSYTGWNGKKTAVKKRKRISFTKGDESSAANSGKSVLEKLLKQQEGNEESRESEESIGRESQ